MLVAELEIRHSRAVAPTRRVALGRNWLPTEPAPGFGGILLAAVVATNVGALDDEQFEELELLLADLEHGRRPPQPRLRHRFQTDVVGLDRSHHCLVEVDGTLMLELDDHGSPLPQILGAVYTAAELPPAVRTEVFRLLRRATRWFGEADEDLIRFLTLDGASRYGPRGLPTDERWALQVLGFGPDSAPGRSEIQHRFRELVREVHPDHGAPSEGAGRRILELTEARRVLVGRAGEPASA